MCDQQDTNAILYGKDVNNFNQSKAVLDNGNLDVNVTEISIVSDTMFSNWSNCNNYPGGYAGSMQITVND